MKSFVVALAILTAATAATAQSLPRQEGADSNDRQENAQDPDERGDRVICRRIRGGMATGSQLTQRRCLTAEQWRRLRER